MHRLPAKNAILAQPAIANFPAGLIYTTRAATLIPRPRVPDEIASPGRDLHTPVPPAVSRFHICIDTISFSESLPETLRPKRGDFQTSSLPSVRHDFVAPISCHAKRSRAIVLSRHSANTCNTLGRNPQLSSRLFARLPSPFSFSVRLSLFFYAKTRVSHRGSLRFPTHWTVSTEGDHPLRRDFTRREVFMTVMTAANPASQNVTLLRVECKWND